MFTCPSPGIQIGSCIRSTPGATSVISSDAVLLLRLVRDGHPCGVGFGAHVGHASDGYRSVG